MNVNGIIVCSEDTAWDALNSVGVMDKGDLDMLCCFACREIDCVGIEDYEELRNDYDVLRGQYEDLDREAARLRLALRNMQSYLEDFKLKMDDEYDDLSGLGC